jgi:hypothetical protein
LHSLYIAVSNMYAMISLYSYLTPCMIRRVNVVPRQWFQYLYVCSSVKSVHLAGEGSMRDARVSLISVDVVSGLVNVADAVLSYGLMR